MLLRLPYCPNGYHSNDKILLFFKSLEHHILKSASTTVDGVILCQIESVVLIALDQTYSVLARLSALSQHRCTLSSHVY